MLAGIVADNRHAPNLLSLLHPLIAPACILFCQLLRSCSTRSLDDCSQSRQTASRVLQTVILEREAAHAATKDIMTVHCIPKDRSADLLPETNGIQTADVPADTVN